MSIITRRALMLGTGGILALFIHRASPLPGSRDRLNSLPVPVPAQRSRPDAARAVFSRRCFWTPADDISRDMWWMRAGEVTSGDGTISLEDNPDAFHARGKLLLFQSRSGRGEAYIEGNIENLVNSVGGGDGTIDHAMPSGCLRLEVCLTGPATAVRICGFWGVAEDQQMASGPDGAAARFSSSNELFFVGVKPNGSHFSFDVAGVASSGSRKFDYGTVVELRLSWSVDGQMNFETRARDEISWTSEFAGARSASLSPIRSIRVGIYNPDRTPAADANLFLSDLAISDQGFADIDRHWYIAGSGTRDVNQSEASIALFCPDGLFRGQAQARVRFAAENDASDATTAFVPLSRRDHSILPLKLTNVEPGTQYTYQFEVADEAGGVLWISEPYRFRTLAAPGVAQASQIGITSCHVQTAMCHPYEHEQYALDNLTADYIGTFHLGDQGYEANRVINIADGYSGFPPELPHEFERQLREFAHDIVLHKLFVAGMYWGTPDDHQWINDGDGTHAPGGSNATLLANAWVGEQSNDSYSADTTLQHLYVTGLKAFDAWFTHHWLDRPTSSARYQKKINGKIEIICLDTRTERMSGAYISPSQLAWVKAQIDAIRPETELVLFVCQYAFGDFATKPSESWPHIARRQFEEFVSYCIANIDGATRFGFVSGDDHIGYLLHDQIASPALPPMPPNFTGELKVSGAATSFKNSSDDYSRHPDRLLWYFDPSRMADSSPIVRSSGVLMSLTADGDSMALATRTAGTEDAYKVF